MGARDPTRPDRPPRGPRQGDRQASERPRQPSDRPPRAPRYELLVTVATGGMATVYIGRQRGAAGFERIIAIKRMHAHIANDPELAAMFRNEARIASLIHHPNVVTVHDVHEEAGEQLLIMDYVDGVSLRQLRHARHSSGARVPRPVSLRIVVDVLRGLHAAHETKDIDGAPLGVVHRDATPHNILLGTDGSIKITDFGIARAADRGAHTSTGRVKGKFAYMSPEQCSGAPLDRRVDVFAIGVVLWELLTGRHLFRGDNDAALVTQIISGRYKRPSELVGATPGRLDAIVMKALAVDPAARWPTAGSLADALEQVAAECGGLAKPAEVGALVLATCGDAVQARRHSLHEVLGGRRPKVAWAAPRSAPPSVGSQSLGPSSSAGSLDSHLMVSDDSVVSPSDFPPARKQSQRLVWVLACLLAAASVGAFAGFFALRPNPGANAATLASSSPPVAASSGARRSAPPPSASAPVVDKVSIRLEADQDFTEVRVPEGYDVEIQDKAAIVSGARGDRPITVHVRLVDGALQQETLVLRADGVQRVHKSPRKQWGGTGTATSQPTPTAVTTSTTPKVGPRYEKDPYQ